MYEACAKINSASDFCEVKKWRQHWQTNAAKQAERGITLMHLKWWFGIGTIFFPAIVRKSHDRCPCAEKATLRKVGIKH